MKPTEEEMIAVDLDKVDPAIIGRVLWEALGSLLETACEPCNVSVLVFTTNGPKWTCPECKTERRLVEAFPTVYKIRLKVGGELTKESERLREEGRGVESLAMKSAAILALGMP